jgi:hypothetical protein
MAKSTGETAVKVDHLDDGLHRQAVVIVKGVHACVVDDYGEIVAV